MCGGMSDGSRDADKDMDVGRVGRGRTGVGPGVGVAPLVGLASMIIDRDLHLRCHRLNALEERLLTSFHVDSL